MNSVESLSHVRLFATLDHSTPGLPVHPNSQSWLKFISIEWMMPSNHLILCHPLLPSNFPNIRVFSDEPVLRIRCPKYWSFSISSLQSLSRARLFATPWISARQASLSITNSQSPPKSMSIESVMPSNPLILCCPLLPSIFSNESVLCIKWPKYWTFSFNSSLTNEHQDWSPLGWTGWMSLQSKELSRVFPKTTVQKHQFFGTWPSLWPNYHICICYWKNHSFDNMDLCWQNDVSAF